jgi:molybdopterin synthase catalytic subunit
MRVTVLLFATLKDRAGRGQVALDLPGATSTVDAVRQALAAGFPAVAPALGSAVSAVNQEFARPEDTVADGDEVAFFPPVSGGCGG